MGLGRSVAPPGVRVLVDSLAKLALEVVSPGARPKVLDTSPWPTRARPGWQRSDGPADGERAARESRASPWPTSAAAAARAQARAAPAGPPPAAPVPAAEPASGPDPSATEPRPDAAMRPIPKAGVHLADTGAVVSGAAATAAGKAADKAAPEVAAGPTPARKAEPVGPAPDAAARGAASAPTPDDTEYDAVTERHTPLRATKVPSSRLGRLLHYGSLGAGLAWGSASDYLRRSADGSASGSGKTVLSEQNVNRLVEKLSRMRGPALKLGQFMSIQDSHMLPAQIEQVMLRVQDSAHCMPSWQLERVMSAELGPEWRKQFATFDENPFAAASIGQVHSATLADPFPAQPHLAGRRVAVKVQFPGIAESISSDLANLKWVLVASALLPRGLFLENSIRVLQQELAEECDYGREAEMGRRFRALVHSHGPSAAVRDSSAPRVAFEVPEVVDSLSTRRVLTTEFMRGRPLTHAARLDQTRRDQIARAVLELSLRELFEWRLMQTDPNWTNFLYNEQRSTIQLIDFGATRQYSRRFMDQWLCLLRAAISGDREACRDWSQAIGYLTGDESQSMVDAHVDAMVALGEPFRADSPSPYPFANQTITDRVRAQIPLMLRERLTPPPPETYSLNRKLSGAFLLCARLGASVECRDMFARITAPYEFEATGSTSPPPVPRRGAQAHPAGTRGLHTAARRARRYEVTPLEPVSRLGQDLGEYWRHAKADSARELREREVESGLLAASREVEAEARGVGAPPPDAPEQAADWPSANTDPPGVVVRGVRVPLRPAPPGPEDCCMSGCVNCVYDLYAADLEEYREKMRGIRTRLSKSEPRITQAEWDTSLLGPLPGEADRETQEGGDTQEDDMEGVDPSMQAFLALEKQIKGKKTA